MQSLLHIIVSGSVIVCCVSSPPDLIIPAVFVGTTIGYFLEALFSSALIKNYFRMPRRNVLSEVKTKFADLLKQWPIFATSGLFASGCLIVDQAMAVLAGEGAVAIVSFGTSDQANWFRPLVDCFVSLYKKLWISAFLIYGEVCNCAVGSLLDWLCAELFTRQSDWIIRFL